MKIGEKIITILGDSEELVGTVGSVVDNHFNVTPLSEEDSGEAALLHSTGQWGGQHVQGNGCEKEDEEEVRGQIVNETHDCDD